MSRTTKTKARTLSDHAHKEIVEHIAQTCCTRQEAANFLGVTLSQVRYACEKYKRKEFNKATTKRKSAGRLATKAEQITRSMTPEELVESNIHLALAQAHVTKNLDPEARINIAVKATRAQRIAQMQRLVNHMKRADAEIIIRLVHHLDNAITEEDAIKLYWRFHDEVKAELSEFATEEEARNG